MYLGTNIKPTTVRQVQQMEGYLSASEVARRLGVTSRTVLRLAHTGDLPGAIKKNPFAQTSQVLIPEASVAAFIDKRDRGIAEPKTAEENAEKDA
jgi:hypothetical protein